MTNKHFVFNDKTIRMLFFRKVVSVMQFMVRILNDVEARFTSVERLHQYEKVIISDVLI